MFRYCQSTKIHFGAGQLNELGHVCRDYGKTCFLVTTPDAPLWPLYERVRELLDTEGISITHFDKVGPNPGVEIIEQEFTILKKQSIDFVLVVGGGNSIDTAEAIALANGKGSIDWDRLFNEHGSPFAYYSSYSEKHLPLPSVPTTPGTGFQVTQAAVTTRGKEKITSFHPDNFSQETIPDPQLTLTLPKRMSAVTGFDVLTHAFESYISANASPYSAMDPMETMRLVIDYPPHALENPQNPELRTNMCLADILAGRALASSGASALYPPSEIIGGIVHLSYGEISAVVFPALIQYIAGKDREYFVDVVKLSDNDDLYTVMIEFLETTGLHKKLRDFGVSEEDSQEIPALLILDYLPFGSREELEATLEDLYA